MTRCAVCGYALIGEIQKGHTYYRCHSKQCRGTSIRESDLIEGVNLYLSLIELSPQDWGDLRDFVDVLRSTSAETAAARRLETQRLLAQCEGRITRLTDAFIDLSIDKVLISVEI